MSSIRYLMGYVEETTTKTPRMEKPDYLSWIKELPCVVTGTTPVDPAHVSFASPEWAAEGRGKGVRVHDSYVLPLCRREHDLQHSCKLGSEQDYWEAKRIDPHKVCSVLWRIWSENKDTATERATRFLSQVRR